MTGRADNDLQIRNDVLAELEFEPQLAAVAIGVAVEDGVVTFTGHVASLGEKQAATVAARRMKGVRAVRADIEVRPAGLPVTDEAIAPRARHIFSWRALPHASPIQVGVRDGWVHLSGRVKTRYEQEMAIRAAWSTPGVTSVIDRIEIG